MSSSSRSIPMRTCYLVSPSTPLARAAADASNDSNNKLSSESRNALEKASITGEFGANEIQYLSSILGDSRSVVPLLRESNAVPMIARPGEAEEKLHPKAQSNSALYEKKTKRRMERRNEK